jgi:phage tail-like protein
MKLHRILGSGVLALLVYGSLGPIAADRSYTSGHFSITVDNTNLGAVQSFDGGTAMGQVVETRTGSDSMAKKQLGGIKYEPITLTTGLGNDKKFYEWISNSWTGKAQPKNGSVQMMDFNYKIQSELQFMNAMIVETTFPALDGSSKDPAKLTVVLAPESTRMGRGSGASGSGSSSKSSAQRWIPANFQLQIDGLDCARVNKISPISVRQAAGGDAVGEARDAMKGPGKLTVSDVEVTFSEVSAPTWQKWADDFLIGGNNGDDKEKNGTITLLGPDLKQQLARVKLYNIGLIQLKPDSAEAGSESIRRMTARLYVERAEFEVLDGAMASSADGATTGDKAPAPDSPAPAATASPTPAAPAPTAAPAPVPVARPVRTPILRNPAR